MALGRAHLCAKETSSHHFRCSLQIQSKSCMAWSFCLFPVLKVWKALGQKAEAKFKGRGE